MRKHIKVDDSFEEIVMRMSEGNPGGLTVLIELMKRDPLLLLNLDDMNIWGWQIWVGYKDYCHEDMDKFIPAISYRDKIMVELINKEAKLMGETERAVWHGASFTEK